MDHDDGLLLLDCVDLGDAGQLLRRRASALLEEGHDAVGLSWALVLARTRGTVALENLDRWEAADVKFLGEAALDRGVDLR